MKNLGRAFRAKGSSGPRPEMGEKLVKFKEQKGSQWEQSPGKTGNDGGGEVSTGRGQGENRGEYKFPLSNCNCECIPNNIKYN